MKHPVNTRTSSGYRTLRFNSVDECSSEIHQIIAASQAGNLKATGNWTPAEIMTHLANWMEYAYRGFPIGPPPFFIRWILRLRLRKMLRDGLPRGVRIPGVEGGTVGMEDIDTIKAARQFLAALERLKSNEVAEFDSPAFGPMSHADRIALNLRHAELHLGFLSY